MRLKPQFPALVAVAALLLAVPALAGYGSKEKDKTHVNRFETGRSLIGATVDSPQGEKLGSVVDIVLDTKDGAIDYAAVETDGMKGQKEELHAVAWNVLSMKSNAMQQNKPTLVMNASKQDLMSAKGFDQNNWPDKPDPRWMSMSAATSNPEMGGHMTGDHRMSGSDRGSHTGNQPMQSAGMQSGMQGKSMSGSKSGTMSGMQSQCRLTKLEDMTVRNRGETIGKVSDVVLDIDAGQPAYVLVNVDKGYWNKQSGMIAVPWKQITVSGHSLIVDLDKAALAKMAYTKGDLRDLEQRAASQGM
jgi:sporulation protein YlmC with PRC-barrel domain